VQVNLAPLFRLLSVKHICEQGSNNIEQSAYQHSFDGNCLIFRAARAPHNFGSLVVDIASFHHGYHFLSAKPKPTIGRISRGRAFDHPG